MRYDRGNKRAPLLWFLFCMALQLIAPVAVLARAGGGGGGSGRGSAIAYLIVLPYLLIHSAIVTGLVVKKNKQCNELLARLAKKGRAWDLEAIQQRIEETFFKVQEAWTQRDQTIAQDYISPRLFQKHKLQTDQMVTEHRRNVLDRINLIEARIVEVADYKDNAKDKVWVYMKGSMIDYMVDDQTGATLSGNPNEPEKFAEIWKFVRGSKGWVLDEIEQNVTIRELEQFTSFSEDAP